MTASRISIALYPEGLSRLQKLAKKYHLTLAMFGPEPEDEKTNVALYGTDFMVMLVINREELEWRYYDLSNKPAVQEYLLSYWLFKVRYPQDELFQSLANAVPIHMVETLLPVYIDALEKSAPEILTGDRVWLSDPKFSEFRGSDTSVTGGYLHIIRSEAEKHAPKS